MQQVSSTPDSGLPTLVYKIAPAALWAEAERAGAFAGAPVDLADGFVHLSTRAQAAETARRHFAGQADLVLAAFDQQALGEGLRYEVSRGGDRFPHHHGPLPLAALRSVVQLATGPDGVPDLALPPLGEAIDPRARGWTTRPAPGFVDLFGPLWHRPEEAGPATALLAGPRHLNRNGIVHGGCLMSLLDEAAGRISYRAGGERRQATIQLDTHFLSPARDGEFLEARGRVVRQTRSVNFLAAEVTAGERVVATAGGIWKMAG